MNFTQESINLCQDITKLILDNKVTSIAKLLEQKYPITFHKWWDYVDKDIFKEWKLFSEDNELPIIMSFFQCGVIHMICQKHPELKSFELDICTDDETIISKYHEFYDRYI